MSSAKPDALIRAALPLLAIVVFGGVQVAVLASSGTTLGYDFLAYHAAAQRVLSGEALYQFGFERPGPFGLFYYPPTFLPLVLPFGLLAPAPATWSWIGTLLAAVLVGI